MTGHHICFILEKGGEDKKKKEVGMSEVVHFTILLYDFINAIYISYLICPWGVAIDSPNVI